VRKGTVLTFRRDPGGQLSAAANALPLVTVRSAPLAAAVFDIYFGEQPVSKRAKRVRRRAARAAAPAAVGRRPPCRNCATAWSMTCWIGGPWLTRWERRCRRQAPP